MEEGRFLVGPDNGLLAPAIERFGGAARAIDLAGSPFRLEPVSATFHGRDLFAPVAAHLALGARLDEAGEKFDPADADAPRAAEPRGRARPRGRPCPLLRPLRKRLARPRSRGRARGGLAPGGRIEVRAPDGRFEASWTDTFVDVGRGELLLYAAQPGEWSWR